MTTRATRLRIAFTALAVLGVGLLVLHSRDRAAVQPTAAHPPPEPRPSDAHESVSRPMVASRDVVAKPVHPPESDDRRAVTVHVVDMGSDAVEDAEIVHFADQGFSIVGRTDAAGALSLPPGVGEAGAVQARKAGYWSEVGLLELRESNVVELRLLRGGTIRGFVRDSAGGPASAEVAVLLWPDSLRSPSSQSVLTGLVGGPYSRATPVSIDGSFVFSDLDPRQTYAMAAGGAGTLSSRAVEGVATDGPPVELEVSPLYGLRVRWVEPGGGPLRSSRQAAGAARVTLQLMGAHPHVEKTPQWLAGLSGLVSLNSSDELYDAVMLYVTRDESHNLGPIRCQVNLPDYAPLSVDLYAWPVQPRLAEEWIELTPISSARGGISVQFEAGGAIAGCRARRLQSAFQLHLASVYNGDRLTYDLEGAIGAESRVDGVPVGEYVARISSRVGFFVWPPQNEPPVNVGIMQDQYAALSVDVASLGSLRLELVDARGVTYTGPAVLVVLPVDSVAEDVGMSDRISELDFHQAPYCINGLTPGRYRVSFRLPKARPHPDDATVDAVVEAGAAVSKVFILSTTK